MHSLQIGATHFHYDAGLEGMTKIVRIKDDKENEELWIPTETLVEFVSELVRAEKIAETENAGVRRLLGLRER